MNLLMGLSKMSDNLEELERRMRKLERTEASVGVTAEDGIHEPSGMTYVDLHWLHHAGSSKNNLPPRPVSTIVRMSYKGEDILMKSLNKYFSNLAKKQPMSVEDVFTPFLNGMLDYAKDEVFGSTSKLAKNSPYTIEMKGKDSPMQDTNQLTNTWKVRINNKVVN